MRSCFHLYNILPPEIDNDGDQRPPDEIVNIHGEYLQLSMNIMIASHTATQAERIISGSIIFHHSLKMFTPIPTMSTNNQMK
nr:MAG TPA: hypothetical protein [Caudoviricetes sp.]